MLSDRTEPRREETNINLMMTNYFKRVSSTPRATISCVSLQYFDSHLNVLPFQHSAPGYTQT